MKNRLTEQEVSSSLERYLEPGEQLRNCAIAYDLSNWAMLFGALGAALFAKFYIVGLTDRRLLFLRYKGRLNVQEITEYRLADISGIRTKNNWLCTLLTLREPRRFSCKLFHRDSSKVTSRQNAQDLVARLQQTIGSRPTFQVEKPVLSAPPDMPPPLPPDSRTNAMALRLGMRRLSLNPSSSLREEDIVGLLSQLQNGVVAIVDRNPNDPLILGLKNLSTTPWTVTLPDGWKHEVAPGRSIKLINGVQINFGFCDGTIGN